MSSETPVLDQDAMQRALTRVAHEVVEQNPDAEIALVGVQRRGAVLARRIHPLLEELHGREIPIGDVDISLYRDDVASRPAAPVVHATHLDFPVAGKTVVIVDDVLYTGRTVRAAIDAVFAFGRPAQIKLAVLCDRGHRELPIRPDHVGKNIPTAHDDRVNVSVVEIDGNDSVVIASR
ncbi:MAG: bifunctional pyr operon transcriptional regulator/uracil phosphoribosyltransferase PyrR [Actinomycetes bacterium]